MTTDSQLSLPKEAVKPAYVAASAAFDRDALNTFDQSAFKAWIDLISYDPVEGRLRPPPVPFDDAVAVNRVLAAFREDCVSRNDLFGNLLYTVGKVSEVIACESHVLHAQLEAVASDYEPAMKAQLGCDLAGFASGRVSIAAGSYGLQFARNVINELFLYLRDRLWRGGFLDTISDSKKKVVVVNGRYRTGTTRILNAVMAVLDAAGEPYKVRGSDFDGVDVAIDCFNAGGFRGYWLLVKSHNWLPRAASDEVIALFSVRNLADVAASAWRLWERSGTPEGASDPANREMQCGTLIAELGFQKLLNDYVALQLPMTTFDYDRYIGHERQLTEEIAKVLDLRLAMEELEAAAYEIEPERVKALTDDLDIAAHPVTRLQRRHISETLGAKHAGLHVLPSRVISYLRAIGEWPFPNRLTIATPIEAVARVFALPNACELLAPGELVAASEVAYRNRNFGLAVQAMKQLVERTSTEPRRWCRLANFQQLAGDVEGAIESYRAAIALDGSLEMAHAGLTKALVASGHRDALGAVELLAPGEIVTVSEIAYRSGNIALAVQAMKRLVDRFSSEPQHWCRLADFQQLAGDISGAIESYRAAVALDGSSETARAGLTKALLASGDPDDALEAAQLQDAADGGGPRGLAIARHLYQTGQFAKAIELLSELAAAPDASAEVHRLLAGALVESGRRNEALEPAVRATALAPERSDYWHFAAMVANLLGYPERAFEWIARAVALDPNKPALLLAQAHLLNGRGLLADAAGVLERAAKRFPLDTAIREFQETLNAHPAGARGA